MRYGSVCSGIEAASLAWEPLGWSAAWFAEIEKFPSQVLAHRWPHVPNLGDMCKLPEYLRMGLIEAPDVLVGGTPCQAFSVAGMRRGLVDPRGALTIKYVEVADAIDEQRPGNECIVVWENVPGVLSDKGNAFGCFIAALVGEEHPLELAGAKCGVVYGPKRSAGWVIKDAQYHGVAQRRRRVFVVASARTGFDPAEILFESEGVRRDTAPSREAGESVTGNAPGGAGSGSHWDHPSNPHPSLNQSFNTGGVGQSNQEIFSQRGAYLVPGGDVLCMAHGQAGAEIRSDGSPSLTCNHEAPIVAYGFQPRIARNGRGDMGDVVSALNAQSGETGKGDAAPCVAVRTAQTSANGHGISEELAHTLDGANGQAVAYPQTQYGDPTARHDSSPCVAMYGIDNEQNICEGSGVLGPLLKDSPTGGGRPLPAVASGGTAGWSVRRLTPLECERLQGMPDGHTAIPNAADGPRYKSIGNSKAVPVVQWLGRRIARYLSCS